MGKVLSFLPHVLTLTGLFFGFSSILCSIQAVNDLYLSLYYQGDLGDPHPEHFIALAGIFILFSSVFDFLDGFFARLLRSDSSLGADLDSLADFISFGIAPGVLFYTVTMVAGNHIPNSGINYHVEGVVPYFFLERLYLFKPLAFLFPICAIVRLARFKMHQSKTHFKGLPSTYAGSVVGIALTFNFYLTPIGKAIDQQNVPDFLLFFAHVYEDFFSSYFALLFTYIFFSFLMISHFRFYRIDFLFRRFNINIFNPFLILLLFISLIFFKYFFVFFALFYLFLSLGNVVIEWIKKEKLDGDLSAVQAPQK